MTLFLRDFLDYPGLDRMEMREEIFHCGGSWVRITMIYKIHLMAYGFSDDALWASGGCGLSQQSTAEEMLDLDEEKSVIKGVLHGMYGLTLILSRDGKLGIGPRAWSVRIWCGAGLGLGIHDPQKNELCGMEIARESGTRWSSDDSLGKRAPTMAVGRDGAPTMAVGRDGAPMMAVGRDGATMAIRCPTGDNASGDHIVFNMQQRSFSSFSFHQKRMDLTIPQGPRNRKAWPELGGTTARSVGSRVSNTRSQIQAYVFDVIRASVPKLLLDDVFEQKNEIAKAVEEELEKEMSAYDKLDKISKVHNEAMFLSRVVIGIAEVKNLRDKLSILYEQDRQVDNVISDIPRDGPRRPAKNTINWQGRLSLDSSPVSRLEMDDMSGRILFPLSSVGGRVKLKGKLGSVISEYDSFWEPSIDMQIQEPIAYSIEMLSKVEPSSLIREEEEDMRELKENYLLPTLHM
ncbi:hypothetical protein F2Q70_00004869 [Brassica cretica]|uniref:Uncharacterized protein n=1 Tax=Brassica cretica TaxID=69181 RepID=A0A8S9J043_BRACR|nr:hypothetical protein F2Q70_00004869 [Brassica cretica]